MLGGELLVRYRVVIERSGSVRAARPLPKSVSATLRSRLDG